MNAFLIYHICTILISIIIILHIKFHKQKTYKRDITKKQKLDRQKVSAILNNCPNKYDSVKDFLEKTYETQVKLNSIDHEIVFGYGGTSFDIESYMRFYDAVKLKNPQKVFECYYPAGRYPYIMATDRSGKSYYAIFCVKTKDTPMGYVQLLHFYEFGSTFSLYWHIRFCEKYVVTSREQVLKQAKIWESGPYEYRDGFIYDDYLRTLKECDSLTEKKHLSEMIDQSLEMIKQSPERLRAITDSDLEPIIEMDENYCYIEWIENHTCDGMYRCKYQISRSDYSIKQVLKNPIVSVTINLPSHIKVCYAL